MERVCTSCHQGYLVGGFNCNHCGNWFDTNTILEYEHVTYLLSEMDKAQWQTALRPEARELALHPYRIAQRVQGFKLGFVPLTAPTLRQNGCLTAFYLLSDLESDPPETLGAEQKARLLKYIAAERDLLLLEYHYEGTRAPDPLKSHSLKQHQAVLESSLDFLEQISQKQLIDNETRQKLERRYQAYLVETRAGLVEEDVAQQTEQSAEQPVEQPVPYQEKRPTEWPVKRQAALVTAEPPPAVVVKPPKPPKPPTEFKWENLWSALLSEATLRALLYLGALFVVVAAALFITLNWNQFPPLIQATMLLGVDLAFFGAGFLILLKLKLSRAGMTFVAIGAAILPLAVYGYSRPELVNLNNRGTWTWVSLLALPCYPILTYFLRERLFSYLTSLAALNALWATLYQFQVAPEWLAVAALPFAVGLIWVDGKLREKPTSVELASAPFWIGQAAVIVSALAIFSYYLYARFNGTPDESLVWALGLVWWLTTGFYGWCAARDHIHRDIYLNGVAITGMVAVYLTLQKLPIPSTWHGFCLALLGALYLAFHNFPDLVSHLNDDSNTTAWKFSDVFALNKPLNNLGWLLMVGSLVMARTPMTLAAGLGLLTVALTLATITYSWKWLAYAAVLAGPASYALVAIYFKLALDGLGLALAGVAVVSFSLWQVTRRANNIRASYFVRPLELLGHLTAAAILLHYPVLYRNLTSVWHEAATREILVRNLLTLALIYGVVAIFYRVRWWVDIAFILTSLALLPRGSDLGGSSGPGGSFGPSLILVGIGLAGVGIFVAEVLNHVTRNLNKNIYRQIYGIPLQQWGYLTTLVGLLLACMGKESNFLLGGGIYIIFALISFGLAHLGWLALLEFQSAASETRNQTQPNPKLAVLWLSLALLLLPFWLWQALALSQQEFGLILGELAVVYFCLGLLLRRLTSAISPSAAVLPIRLSSARPFLPLSVYYKYPALVGWLILGTFALVLVSDSHVNSLLVGGVLAATCVAATLTLKTWRFNWLVAILGLWWAWNGYQLVGLNNEWAALVLAVLAVGFVAGGEWLGRDYGAPFRVNGHLLAVGSVLTALLNNSAISSSSLRPNALATTSWQVLALLVSATMYAALAIVRQRPNLFYTMGLIATLTVPIVGYWLKLALSWPLGEPQNAAISWGYIVLAALTAAVYPLVPLDRARSKLRPVYARETPSPRKFVDWSWDVKIETDHPLSYLAHGWAALALLTMDSSLALQAFVPLGILLLYVGRSWYERQAGLLVIVGMLGVLAVVNTMRLVSAPFNKFGLALIGLATLYLALAEIFKALQKRPAFNYRLAAQIFRYSGQILIFSAALLSLVNQSLVDSMVVLALVMLLSIWQTATHREELLVTWASIAVTSGLASYAFGFSVLKVDWFWFGLALLVPAALIGGAGFGTARYLVQRSKSFNLLGQALLWVAVGVVIVGLPFSWQKDSLMLAHTLIIALGSTVLLRVSRRIEWLYGAVGAGCYTAALTIHLLGVGPSDYGLALLVVSGLCLVAMLYLSRWAVWLEEAPRTQGVAVLAATAQGLALTGLSFSWVSDGRLALNLGVLTAFYLFNLVVTRWIIWLYAALVTGHLTYLAMLSALITGGTGLTPLQAGLALLPVGLVMTGLAVRFGLTTGYNLQAIIMTATRPTNRFAPEKPSLVELNFWLSLQHYRSLPLYLAAAADLIASLYLVANDPLAGLVVAGLVTLTLIFLAAWEENEQVAWLALAPAALAYGYCYSWFRLDLATAGLYLSILALGLSIIGYGVSGWKRFKVLERPARYTAHMVVVVAFSLWAIELTTHQFASSMLWESLSWLMAFTGLNYLLVSALERRRISSNPAPLRYLGYGAVILLEVAFVLRLAQNSINQLQLYVLPVGLACLIFGWLERRNENRRSATLLEGLGLTVLLGTSLLQAFGFQSVGLDKNWYGGWLLIESLLAIGWGAANRLRYYFFGGIITLLLSLATLLIDPARASDKWVTLGLTGLTLITIALFLERKREAVIRVSKDWLQRVKQWE